MAAENLGVEESETAAAEVVAINPMNLRALLRKPKQPFTIPPLDPPPLLFYFPF